MNSNNCTDGYATDEWLIYSAKDQVGNCETPYIAFQIICFVAVAQEIISLAIATVSFIKTKKSDARKLFIIGMVNCTSKLVIYAISLADRDFGARNILLWLLYLIFGMTLYLIVGQALNMVTQISGALNAAFAVEGMAAKLSEYLNNSVLYKLNVFLATFSFSAIVTFWVVLPALSEQAENEVEWLFGGDEKLIDLDIFWFRIGCGCVAIILLCMTFLVNLRLELLVQFLKDLNETSSVDILKAKLKRLKVVGNLAAILGSCIWFCHTFFLPMYWYIAFFHFFNASIGVLAVMYVFSPLRLERLDPTMVAVNRRASKKVSGSRSNVNTSKSRKITKSDLQSNSSI